MLAFDQGDELFLARALPRDWLASGKPIAAEGLPTPWGRVGLELQCRPAEQRIDGEVLLPAQGSARTWLTLRVPAGNALRKVTVDDREANADGPHGDRVELRAAHGSRVRIQAFYG